MNTNTATTATGPLFCKNCKHFDKPSWRDTSVCTASATQIIDLVDGYQSPACSMERRNHGGACGPDGILFVQFSPDCAASVTDCEEWATRELIVTDAARLRQRKPYEGLATMMSDRSRSSLSKMNRASVVSSANTVATTASGTSAPSTDAQIDFAVTSRS